MSEKHLSSQFDTDLTSISTKVLQMGGLVEAQIARAMRALANFDTAMCDQVLAVEQEINALEIEIDGDCNNIIARRQPTARDLRLVMAISKTITNLERAGDEAAKIAKRTKRLMQDPSAHALNYAGMSCMPIRAWKKACNARCRSASSAKACNICSVRFWCRRKR